MAQAITTDAAISAVRDAILRLVADSQVIWSRATAEAREVVQRCDAAVRQCRAEVDQIVQALRGARTEEEASHLAAALQQARQRLHAAEAALSLSQRAVGQLESARRAAQRSSDLAGGAVAALRYKLGSLDGYRAGVYPSGATGSSPGSVASPSTATSAFGNLMTSRGLADVDVGVMRLDRSDLDQYPRGGLEKSDFAWAAVQWEESVRPGLESGLTRDDFAARDTVVGARAPRSLAEVHDLFLGTDCIWGDRRPDGGVDIRGGQHRVRVAQEMGIRTLPVRIGGSS